jgi:translation initiation factor IF-3
VPELLVIGDDGKSLGVLKFEDALRIADEKGVDLIEVSPLAKPPVARIMNYDKYRYEESKKLKKQRIAKKNLELKQVQLSGRIAANDLQIKAKKIGEFMAAGHPINIVLTLRGREKGNQQFAHEKLKQFLAILPTHRVIAPPKFMGRGIHVQIVPVK